MTKSIIMPVVLSALLVSFALGWRVPAATPTGLVAPLNMTLSDQTLYVSDQFTGVHVYDVADPSAPRAVATIALEGNRGTAVKDDVLYASEQDNLNVYKREGDTFTLVATLEPERGGGYDYGPPNPWYEGGGNDSNGFACMCASNSMDGAPMPASSGSSYATFAVIGDYLYRADYFALVVYDIAKPDEPKELKREYVGSMIETIYPTEQYLFLGGTRGMSIYDRSNPAAPHLIGSVTHFRACDPVVVSGSVAYVTLRGGNACGDTRDVLLTVNLADPSHPFIAAEKELATPFGLVVREPFLYVSTGESGYSLLDVTRPTEPSTLGAWGEWPTKDFLWSGDLLYVLGFDDLRIYNVGDPKAPVLLSTIENDPS
jgi:hypothetical protein